MSVVDPDVFVRLNRFWEEVFKNPKEVALGAEYLPNLLGPAIGALKAHQDDEEGDVGLRGETGRDADVAIRLLRDALGGDPVVALLRWEAPEKVRHLNKLLTQDTVDASEVPKALRILKAILSEDLARRAIAAQLGAGEAADAAVLRGAAVVLACRDVGRFPESQTKKLLKRSFARAVVLALLEEHSDRMRRNTGISGELEAIEERAIRAAVARGGAGSEDGERSGGEDGDLFAMYTGEGWRRSAYRLIALAKRMWTAELGGHAGDWSAPVAALGKAVARLEEDRAAQERMARAVIVRYSAYWFLERFRVVSKSDGRETDQILGEAAATMERELGELGVSRWPERSAEDPASFPPIATRSAFALSSALPIALSEACAEGYARANPELVAETAGRLGERLTGFLAEEVGASGSPGNGDEARAADTAEALCAAWAARRRLHREMGEVLAGLDLSIEGYLRGLPAENTLGNATAGDRFWTTWRRNYAAWAARSSSIPWDAVDDARVVERAVAEATSRFGGALDDYLIVFRVEGIKPDGMSWRMADVTFYDPEHFDYGEGREASTAPEDSPGVCHAAVRVSADTTAGAVRSARQRLIVGLDCYSFGLSGDPLRPDFNPRVMDWEHVVNLSEEWGSPNYERTVPFYGEQGAADLDLPGMARAYAALLAKAAGNPRGLTQLQDRFVRAVHWLREARFDSDPAKRFILHYVGMEHIFARGEGSDAVARLAPRLNKTWKDVARPIVHMNMAFNSLHKTVREDAGLREIADSDGELRNWDRDERVLLDPDKVRVLLERVPEDHEEARGSASMLLDILDSLKADAGPIADQVERLRDLQTVKVRRLQMLRNTVVHDALYQDERMRYYAQEAHEILDDALRKMAEEVTSENPDCETIDQLVEKYEGQPWAPS